MTRIKVLLLFLSINIFLCGFSLKDNTKTQLVKLSNGSPITSTKQRKIPPKQVTVKMLHKEYDISTAISNDDVVYSSGQVFNIEKLDKSIKLINKKDHKLYLRITTYTEEGTPTIKEIMFQKNTLRLTIDTTRETYSSDRSLKSYTIKKIILVKTDNYTKYDAVLKTDKVITLLLFQ